MRTLTRNADALCDTAATIFGGAEVGGRLSDPLWRRVSSHQCRPAKARKQIRTDVSDLRESRKTPSDLER